MGIVGAICNQRPGRGITPGMTDDTDRRDRLREELQQAYDNWIAASMSDEVRCALWVPPVDISGCADPAKPLWFRYLQAQERLIAAFGEP